MKKEIIDTLKSIASNHKPKHGTKKFWLSISHQDCAEVLANDTKLARRMLKKLEKKK